MPKQMERFFHVGSLDWFTFYNLMNTAYVMNWTGAVLIGWKPAPFDAFFRRSDREKLAAGKVYIFMQRGVIANISFTSKPGVDFFDESSALGNLVLLIRALEGMSDAPKLPSVASYH